MLAADGSCATRVPDLCRKPFWARPALQCAAPQRGSACACTPPVKTAGPMADSGQLVDGSIIMPKGEHCAMTSCPPAAAFPCPNPQSGRAKLTPEPIGKPLMRYFEVRDSRGASRVRPSGACNSGLRATVGRSPSCRLAFFGTVPAEQEALNMALRRVGARTVSAVAGLVVLIASGRYDQTFPLPAVPFVNGQIENGSYEIYRYDANANDWLPVTETHTVKPSADREVAPDTPPPSVDPDKYWHSNSLRLANANILVRQRQRSLPPAFVLALGSALAWRSGLSVTQAAASSLLTPHSHFMAFQAQTRIVPLLWRVGSTGC